MFYKKLNMIDFVFISTSMTLSKTHKIIGAISAKKKLSTLKGQKMLPKVEKLEKSTKLRNFYIDAKI